MSFYYKVWVNCIVKLRSRPENVGMWKYMSIMFMSIAMAVNFTFIMAILQRNIIKNNFYDIKVNILPGTILDSFIKGFILYFLPFLLFNYFMIFYKNKYKRLIERYEYHNGKLFIVYFLLSLWLPVLILITGMIIIRL